MESRQEGKSGQRTILCPARSGLLAIDGPRPGTLSPELTGAEQSGERRTVPWRPVREELDESERTRGDSAMSTESQQIHLSLAKMFQCSKHGQYLQALDVPREMATTHDRTPNR